MKYIKEIVITLIGAAFILFIVFLGYLCSLFDKGYMIIFIFIGLVLSFLVGNMVVDISKDIKRNLQKRRESR